jgi:hypothetical protein
MATQEVALRYEQSATDRGSQISNVQRLGGLLAASGYFSDAREMAQAAVKVLAGEELGIPPVAAMMGMYIVKGKIVLSGNLIASRIRAHGYNYKHKQFDSKGCVLQFIGKSGEILGESAFTEEDAKAAQCFTDMYKKYPRNMYFNRAISNGAKWYTPEVFAGAPVYVAEELGQQVDEQGDMIQPEPEAHTPTPQQVAESKIAQMKAGVPYAETKVEVPMIPQEVQPVEQAEASIKARLAQFEKIKTSIGREAYYRILGAAGYTHANEIRSLSVARQVYRDMAQAWDDQRTAALSMSTDAEVSE